MLLETFLQLYHIFFVVYILQQQESMALEHYQVQSMTSGKGALGEVMLRLRVNDNEYTGKGISTDTIEASSKAYLDALNHFEKFKDLQPVLDGITAI